MNLYVYRAWSQASVTPSLALHMCSAYKNYAKLPLLYYDATIRCLELHKYIYKCSRVAPSNVQHYFYALGRTEILRNFFQHIRVTIAAEMSIQKVNTHIDAIDRKLGKSLKIAEKGNDLKLGDVVKLGRKTNSICSEINKSVKEYDVRQRSGPT